MTKMKLCFVALASYPIISGKDINIVGGAEVQQVLLAKNLKSRFNISFITYDFGQRDGEIIDGITLFKTFPDKNKTGFLEKIKRFMLFWKALKKADANIYYFRGAGLENGIVAFFCRIYKRRFVHGAALDEDLTANYLKNGSYLNNLLYKYGLKNASLIIVQSRYQSELLKNNFNLESEVIKNGIILPKPYEKDDENKKNILWAATIKNSKNPLFYLKLAEQFPGIKFQMIGGPGSGEEELYNKILENSKKIRNIEYLGFQPYHLMEKYFQEAMIFVNTSEKEGFPNTFLQAWCNYVPVISLYVDPDECICKYKLGFHSRSYDQMVKDLKALIVEESIIKKMGEKSRKFVEIEHDINIIARSFEKKINLIK